MLWEALAGRHPFWRSSLLETARAIEDGAPPLESARPDLPKPLLAAVNRALDLDPAAARAPAALAADAAPGRSQAAAAARARSRRSPFRRWSPRRRAAALLAALVAGWAAWAIPFYPSGWAIGLALVAAGRDGGPYPRRARLRRSLCRSCRSGISRLGRPSSTGSPPVGLLVLSWREPEAGCCSPSAPCSRRSPGSVSCRSQRSGCARPCGGGSRSLPPCSWRGSWRDSRASRSRSTARRRRPGSGSPRAGDPFDGRPAPSGTRSSHDRGSPSRRSCSPRSRSSSLRPGRDGPWAVAGLGAVFLAASLLLAPGGRRGAACGGRLGDLCRGSRPLASIAGYCRLWSSAL